MVDTSNQSIHGNLAMGPCPVQWQKIIQILAHIWHVFRATKLTKPDGFEHQ